MGERKSVLSGAAYAAFALAIALPALSRAESPRLAEEIAAIEQQVDRMEAAAIAAIRSLRTEDGSALPGLGKLLFYDKNLSVARNQACAFCHMPQTGYQGAIESINLAGVSQPGSIHSRFGPRKPLSAAYAVFSPPLFYAIEPGKAKCTDCFIGGNFWDVRATGHRLQSASASQAEGSPLNPDEMANPDPACVVYRISARPYRALFESIWGPRAFDVNWPDDTEAICDRPNSNAVSAIAFEVPDPNTAPLVVNLDPRDRARVRTTFDQMAQSIAAFEASSEVSAFSSKFDAFLAGKVDLSEEERRGYELFRGKAKCNDCHVADGPKPLFTDNSTANIGVPRNPDLSYFNESTPDKFGYVVNRQGSIAVDLGVGNFLRSPENGITAWRTLAPQFDGRFRVPTLRNVDKRPRADFVKAYSHNGYFKSLEEIVHYYNTRDTLPRCAVGTPGETISCWPAPEVDRNLNS
jgi:cytochrome c peroxidase